MCYRVSNPRYELFCQNRRSPGTTQPVRRLARGRLGFGLAALAPPKDRGLPGARPYVRDLATSRSIRAGAKCPPRRPRGEREGYGGPRDVTSPASPCNDTMVVATAVDTPDMYTKVNGTGQWEESKGTVGNLQNAVLCRSPFRPRLKTLLSAPAFR